jgi:GT2 family glycosyltransferase
MEPSPDPRIAVVMITYNRCAETLRSLEKLLALPEQPSILLVDNGSTDDTVAVVQEHFPQVEVLEAGGNLGAAGRNLGIRRVASPYVALCDDDTWWEPGSLRRAADLFDAHPRLALLTARVLVGSEEQEDPACMELEESPLPATAEMPGRPILGFLAGASVVRQSAFLECGGFAERASIGGEEALLAVDLATKGWWLCYAPELVVHHYPSPQRNVQARRANEVRNALWFAWLRRPFPSVVRRTFRLARQLPWDSATRRGFVAAALGLPAILRQRRVVPPDVEHGLRLLEAR